MKQKVLFLWLFVFVIIIYFERNILISHIVLEKWIDHVYVPNFIVLHSRLFATREQINEIDIQLVWFSFFLQLKILCFLIW